MNVLRTVGMYLVLIIILPAVVNCSRSNKDQTNGQTENKVCLEGDETCEENSGQGDASDDEEGEDDDTVDIEKDAICETDDKCAMGQICDGSKCIDGCRDDEKCSVHEVCNIDTKRCEAECAVDDECEGETTLCSSQGSCQQQCSPENLENIPCANGEENCVLDGGDDGAGRFVCEWDCATYPDPNHCDTATQKKTVVHHLPSQNETYPMDVLICYDRTGSMKPFINEIKENIATMLIGLTGTDFRVGLLPGYLKVEDNGKVSGGVIPEGDMFVSVNGQITNDLVAQIKSKFDVINDNLVSSSESKFNEMCLAAIYHAMTTKKEINQEKGFFRKNAALTLVTISDENDECWQYADPYSKIYKEDGQRDEAFMNQHCRVNNVSGRFQNIFKEKKGIVGHIATRNISFLGDPITPTLVNHAISKVYDHYKIFSIGFTHPKRGFSGDVTMEGNTYPVHGPPFEAFKEGQTFRTNLSFYEYAWGLHELVLASLGNRGDDLFSHFEIEENTFETTSKYPYEYRVQRFQLLEKVLKRINNIDSRILDSSQKIAENFIQTRGYDDRDRLANEFEIIFQNLTTIEFFITRFINGSIPMISTGDSSVNVQDFIENKWKHVKWYLNKIKDSVAIRPNKNLQEISQGQIFDIWGEEADYEFMADSVQTFIDSAADINPWFSLDDPATEDVVERPINQRKIVLQVGTNQYTVDDNKFIYMTLLNKIIITDKEILSKLEDDRSLIIQITYPM